MGIDGEVWLLDDQNIVEMPEAERRMYSKKISPKHFHCSTLKYIPSQQIIKKL